MFILEEPYISERMLEYAEKTQIPVLKTPFSENLAQKNKLNLMGSDLFQKELLAGKRLYATSENALSWVYENIADSTLAKNCDIMKDKSGLRHRLSSMYPDFFFKEVPYNELKNLDLTEVKFPFVLKPKIGFLSIGVYTINNANDFFVAIKDLEKNIFENEKLFPQDVLKQKTFLLEEYIQGEEFAVDVYFNEKGEPVITNILQHDFASNNDVSDRLYFTGKDVIEKNLEKMTTYFSQVNSILQIKDFPAHVELRIKDNKIIPIEFNPLRFAGMCSTDIAYFAYGHDTFDLYLNNEKPNFENILKDKTDKIYAMIVLNKMPNYKTKDTFNFSILPNYFQKILDYRDMQHLGLPLYGFVMAETDVNHQSQLDYILHSDLQEFLN